MNKIIIAIDGAAGTGKSTISKIVANKLGFAFVKTGEMYRAITYKLIKENIELIQIDEIKELLDNIDLQFKYNNENQIAILDGIDITKYLTSKDVTNLVSQVSAIKCVRDKVLFYEINSAKENNIVMEGRDIGTIIFPNADVKIFLVASVEERAKRRYKQNLELGIKTSYEEIKQNIAFRDENDTKKEHGAMTIADDAVIVENNNRTIESTINEIMQIIDRKIGDRI